MQIFADRLEADVTVHERVMDEIRRMSVADLVDLVRAISNEFVTPEGHAEAGVRQPGRVAARSPGGVSLRDLADDRIAAISAVREGTDLRLREARELVASAPARVAQGLARAMDSSDPDDWEDGTEAASVPAVPKPPLPQGTAAAGVDLPEIPPIQGSSVTSSPPSSG